MFLLIFLLALAPHRIISVAPSITEILFALGAGDQVVGDTTYCNYPEAAKTKPKIGGFTTPNIEAILSLKPDLVFMTNDRPDIAQKLGQARSLDVVTVNPDNIEGIYRSIQSIAEKIGTPEKGKALIQSIEKEIRQAPRTRGTKPKVLFIVGRTPGTLTDLIVVGRGSYLSELIDLAGGINVADDARVQYPHFSLEEIIHRDPDIIIDMGNNMGDNEKTREAQKRAIKQLWQKYSFLRAVRRDAVYPISADYFVTPGPRVGQAVRDLREIFSK
jgi:iron complex transport system substrate-binding protein